MADKVLNTRVQQKHDIEANWLKAVNFIPKIGEVIVYDPDENHAAARVKIGDGERTVGQLPFISGQADWNVNDESSVAYVKNRTHWEEELEPIVIFEEQEVELVTDRYVASSNHLGFTLKPNTKYRVIFDGKEYEGVSYYEDEHKDTIYLFNELYQNDNLDDIFCIVTYLPAEPEEEPITYLEVRAKDEGTYTFALYELTTNVHQLDPKFIPTASEEQLVQLLIDIDALPAMTDSNGAIFTHKDSILLI